MTDFAAARLNMIESQVRPNGITDRRIITAMENIPRENFVPENRKPLAYMDEDVALDPADKASARMRSWMMNFSKSFAKSEWIFMSS